MNLVAVTRLHYGADYLDAVIRSVAGVVRRHVILYTPVPTFGHRTDLPCPDSREELLAIASKYEHVQWFEDLPIDVNSAWRAQPDADLVLELDADEVIHPDLLKDIIKLYMDNTLTEARYSIPFVHHWRSFGKVCRDQHQIVRLYTRHWDRGQAHITSAGAMHHFGYARSVADTAYKIGISAHKSEWRPGWWEDIFLANRQEDIHPVCLEGFWNTEDFCADDLPPVLNDHPYYYEDIIE